MAAWCSSGTSTIGFGLGGCAAVFGSRGLMVRQPGPHSMTHWADNYATVGRIRIISTSVTETPADELEVGHQDPVKEDQQVGNNQASFRGLLKNNMEVEAAMEPSGILTPCMYSLILVRTEYIQSTTMPYDGRCTY
jgi:hypothetical protein